MRTSTFLYGWTIFYEGCQAFFVFKLYNSAWLTQYIIFINSPPRYSGLICLRFRGTLVKLQCSLQFCFVFFINAARKPNCLNIAIASRYLLSILIGYFHRTMSSFSTFIGSEHQLTIHFNAPNSLFQPRKCATMPDKMRTVQPTARATWPHISRMVVAHKTEKFGVVFTHTTVRTRCYFLHVQPSAMYGACAITCIT